MFLTAFSAGDSLIRELINRGYNVVLLVEEKEFAKFKEFWSGGRLIIPNSIDSDVWVEVQLALSTVSLNELAQILDRLTSTYSWAILETYPILVKKPPKLVMSDVFTRAGFIIAEKFNIPAVAIWVGQSMPSVNDFISPLWYPAANSMSTHNFMTMTYFEMVKNVFTRLFRVIIADFFTLKSHNIKRRHFGVRELDHVTDITQQYPLFISSPIGLDFAHPVLPSHFLIGPYFRPDYDKKVLPNDLQLWLDEAPNVIYISFGTYASPTLERIQIIHLALTKQNKTLRYLWSLSEPFQYLLEKANINQLSNVRYSSYLPQIEILKHENVILFISHGGFNSVAESLIFNKPMLIIPLTPHLDHVDNGLRVEKSGCGIMHLGWNLKPILLQQQISLLLQNITVNIDDNMTYPNPIDFKRMNHFFAAAHRIGRLLRSAGGTTRAATIIEEFLEFGYQHLIFNQPNYKQSFIIYSLVLLVTTTIIALLVLLPYCCCRICYRKFKPKLVKQKRKAH
ncbi:unnamed protein product [Didymodactylos carnosus]|uniref:UDP-glucuronosyltransferase n=1 Tax=Didymodactylos carnosus TaxID=1234261 RepID=A0A815GBB4_9BILA|nr:unnamed protein product [Didymodactylos carnosus]CAF4195126.1 unnamed protein product [Didymodactylos carnosus]